MIIRSMLFLATSACVIALGLSRLAPAPILRAQSRAGRDTCSSPPGNPFSLNVVVNGSSVTLTWQPPLGGCPPTSYVIEAGSAQGSSELASFATGNTATSYTVQGVANGTYYVRVRATNTNGSSAESNSVQAIVGNVPCQGPPSAPSGLGYTTNGTSLTLYWDPPPGSILSYVIEAGSTSGSTNLAQFDTASAATSFSTTTAIGTYYLRIRSRNSCGTGGRSAELVVVIGGTPTPTPTPGPSPSPTPSPDNVTILMADIGAERFVRMTDMAGSNWETGPAVSPRPLSTPWHIAVDSRGRIYAAEKDTGEIVRMDDLAGHGWKTFGGVGSNRLATPPDSYVVSVAIDAVGRIYIGASCRIVRIDDMDGTGLTTYGACVSDPSMPGSFNNPKVVIFDQQGRMLISDTDHGRIVRMDDMRGTGWTTFGSIGGGVGQFNRLEGLAVDSLGRIYVADHDNHRIERIDDMTGAGWISLGSQGSGVRQFDQPHDIAVSPSGKIYIADTANARIVRIDDMTGAGWTTFGTRTVQPPGVGPCPGPPGCRLAGLFEFIAPKGLRILPR